MKREGKRLPRRQPIPQPKEIPSYSHKEVRKYRDLELQPGSVFPTEASQAGAK